MSKLIINTGTINHVIDAEKISAYKVSDEGVLIAFDGDIDNAILYEREDGEGIGDSSVEVIEESISDIVLGNEKWSKILLGKA